MSTTIGGLRFTISGGDIDDVLIGKLARQYGGDNWRALYMDIRTLVAGHLELYDKAWTKTIKSNKRNDCASRLAFPFPSCKTSRSPNPTRNQRWRGLMR